LRSAGEHLLNTTLSGANRCVAVVSDTRAFRADAGTLSA
jgi:hypothetical protein